MATRHVVADVSELPAGQGRVFEVAGRQIALFHVGGNDGSKFHAIENQCPHRGGPLGDGPLTGTTVTCPWHGWQFDCTTGRSTRNASVCVASFAAGVDGSSVYVEL